MRRILGTIYALSTHGSLRSLRKAERMFKEEVLALRDARLRALLAHAFANVPYYRRVLKESGVVDDDGRVSLENFDQVPFLTKDTIRTHSCDLVSKDLHKRKFYYNTSGGSTGEPVRLVQDAEYKRWIRAGKLLYDLWTGYQPGMPKVVLWGSERDLFVGRETLGVRINRWIRNEVWLNAFRMTEPKMREYVEVINLHKPVQILAYVESIYELARFIDRNGLSVHSPRAIMTSAGTLYPHMRQVIERVFRAPVFNRYGSREVGDIACECEVHKGLHVSPLTHYVEIIRKDGTPAAAGEVGEVVVTSLVNYAMPLIRYRIGDMAAWAEEECSCGRSWPLLKEVVGRVSDVFVTATGTQVHGEYFTHLLYFKEWVRKFQFIQEDYHHIRLLVVPAVDLTVARGELERDRADIERKVKLVMGEESRLEVELVDDILPSPSGKYRYTISKVVRHP